VSPRTVEHVSRPAPGVVVADVVADVVGVERGVVVAVVVSDVVAVVVGVVVVVVVAVVVAVVCPHLANEPPCAKFTTAVSRTTSVAPQLPEPSFSSPPIVQPNCEVNDCTVNLATTEFSASACTWVHAMVRPTGSATDNPPTPPPHVRTKEFRSSRYASPSAPSVKVT